MTQNLVDKGPKVQIWNAGIDFADEVLIIPMRFFNLKTYTLKRHSPLVVVTQTIAGKVE
jgi:hypothetical protein